jgi:NAD(P)H dehydrogenase (quinone)
MPKLLVLFHDRSGDTAALADAIAEGARSVRFTEVDVRRLADVAPADPTAPNAATAAAVGAVTPVRVAPKHRFLDSLDSLADYDAVILGVEVADGGVVSPELQALLTEAGPLIDGRRLRDKVGSAFTASCSTGHDPVVWTTLQAFATMGMILVAPPVLAPDSEPAAVLHAGKHHGQRVAKVAEWVRHAKGHESGEHGHHH